MFQVSRTNNLKIPKTINAINEKSNNTEDIIAIKKGIAVAENKKINEDRIRKSIELEDEDIKLIEKLPYNSNDLVVITIAKKLCAYVITITEKSPKKFRGVFVNRMQNYSLDTIEYLLEANFIKMDSIENKKREKNIKKKQ